MQYTSTTNFEIDPPFQRYTFGGLFLSDSSIERNLVTSLEGKELFDAEPVEDRVKVVVVPPSPVVEGIEKSQSWQIRSHIPASFGFTLDSSFSDNNAALSLPACSSSSCIRFCCCALIMEFLYHADHSVSSFGKDQNNM